MGDNPDWSVLQVVALHDIEVDSDTADGHIARDLVRVVANMVGRSPGEA